MTDSVVIVSCPSLIIGGKYSTNFGGGGGIGFGWDARGEKVGGGKIYEEEGTWKEERRHWPHNK